METINYALIGDVHSQAEPLNSALQHCRTHGLTPILLGDLFDSRVSKSHSVQVYNLAREAEKEGAIILRSNHQNKFERYARGNNVAVYPDFQRTLQDFEEGGVSIHDVAQWLETFPYGVAFRDSRGVEYRCCHAYFPERILIPPSYEGLYRIDSVSRGTKDLMLYGLRIPGANWPQEEARVFWWNNQPPEGQDWIRVAGHYHHVFIDDHSIVVDGECGGGMSGTPEEDCHLCLWDVENQSLHEFY